MIDSEQARPTALADRRASPDGTRRATLRDVSRLAGVSPVTLSRALGEPGLLKRETLARVMRAVSSLGYVPDRAAGRLSMQRSGLIEVVLPSLANVNFAKVAQGLTQVLRAGDFDLLLTYDDYSVHEEERQVRSVLARRPEAIVLTGASHSAPAAALLLRAGIPVIAGADLSVRPIQHAVGLSNHRIGQLATRHLMRRGFRRIGVLASSRDGDRSDRTNARIAGFVEELRLHEMAADLIVGEAAPPLSYDACAAGITRLLDRAPDVEAVFCVSDRAAVSAVMECQRRGISAPDGLARR